MKKKGLLHASEDDEGHVDVELNGGIVSYFVNSVVDNTPKDILVVQRDWNAKMG